MSPTMQDLIDVGDYQSLLRILRRHPDPRFRGEAARLLLQLQNPESIEGLIRSALDDADPSVRAASNHTLHQYLGKTEAELALSAYGSVDGVMPYEKEIPAQFSWMEEGNEGAEDSDDEHDYDPDPEPDSDDIIDTIVAEEYLDFSREERPIRWDPEDIEPLLQILTDDNHPDRQMKALRIVAGHPTSAGVDALSTVALWSENPLVKNSAYKALEQRYGDDTGRLLEEFRIATASAAEEEDEEDEDTLEVEIPLSSINPPESSRYNQPSAIKPEGINERGMLFLFLLLLGIAAFLVYWFILR